MPMCGSSSLSYLIISLSLLLLKVRSSVCTVVSLHLLTHSTKSDSSTEYKRSLMKVQSATYCGLIQMIDAAGVSLLVELVTPSDKIFQNNSTMQIISN